MPVSTGTWLTWLFFKNANSRRAIIERRGRRRTWRWTNTEFLCWGEGNKRPVIHRFEAFLPLITVDDWTGQDSLAEEFPLSGRNGIQPRILVEVQRFRAPDCSLIRSNPTHYPHRRIHFLSHIAVSAIKKC